MSALRRTDDRHRLLSAMLGLALALCTLALTCAPRAQDIASTHAADPGGSGLDGMRFVGPFGAEAETNPEDDAFTFKDGKFVSASCRKWGFAPAPYWTRRDAAGLHFLAELESKEHGRMRYEGVFDGKELNAVAYWKKERWYWTVERTYRFRGRPAKPGG